ncbi:hypothetical protein M0811_03010 [Anaeramoeba ignava]|uniref:Uncharacterized protein n=1 Tax=Anaeramoeba ignava TaxID=1746090 RepID=A0A9Q0LAP5_ANAIG|nr:hypothetical protein M0811_03010 [Anaeramoeba ignava]
MNKKISIHLFAKSTNSNSLKNNSRKKKDSSLNIQIEDNTIHKQKNQNQNQKWVVLYLNDLLRLSRLESHVVSKQIMTYLFARYGIKLFEKCNFDYDEQLWNKKKPKSKDKRQMIKNCKNFFENLFELNVEEFKFMIAIDEYNILYREKFPDPKHILNIFKDLRNIRNGLMITAVSSSFDQDKIPYIDFQEFGVKTKRFTESEFESIFEWKRKEGTIPQYLTRDYWQQFTNAVPRVLYMVSRRYRTSKNESFDESTFLLNCGIDCIDHYKKRVRYVLQKIKEIKNPETIKQDIQLPTLICLNENITSLPEFWELSGLFETQFSSRNSNFQQKENENDRKLNQKQPSQPIEKQVVPICSWVTSAILEIFRNDGVNSVNFLCSYDIKWKALELFVLNGFQNFSSTSKQKLTLSNRNLKGKKQENPETFQISIKRIVYQDQQKSLEDISIGDLIVCYKGHSVVDFVCLSKNENQEKELFYFQVSILDYAHHDKKVDSLFKRDFKPTKQKKTSILEYYSKLSGIKLDENTSQFIERLSKQNQKKKKEEISPKEEKQEIRKNSYILPPNQYYVYITSTSNFLKSSQYSQDPVILVNGQHLNQINPFDYAFCEKVLIEK